MSAARSAMEGLEKVLENLNKEVAAIEGRTMKGLLEGGLIVQGESQRRVPVEYGKMRASAYTRRAKDAEGAVEVGYSAAYAVWVHENLEQKLKGEPRPSGLGKYWGPNGQPKFLQTALEVRADDLVKAVAKNVKVKD